MRFYPSASRLERKCVKDYAILNNGNNLKIPKGSIVAFVTDGFHKDERYWENPTTFDPERFSPANKGKLNPYAYFPFGQGPRNCIGMCF